MVQNPPANARDAGLIPGLGRFPGEGNSNAFQYSCLGIPWTAGDERTLKGGNRLLGMNKWIYCVISGFGRAEFLLLQRKWLSLLGDLV